MLAYDNYFPQLILSQLLPNLNIAAKGFKALSI